LRIRPIDPQAMRLSDFDFHLPEKAIALRPAERRDSARLLVVQQDRSPAFADGKVRDLLQHLRKGDVMVFNDTRVIPAQLSGIRFRDAVQAKVEITLHKRAAADEWIVFARPGKRLAVDDRITFLGEAQPAGPPLQASVVEKSADGDVRLRFDRSGPVLDEAVALSGRMPLPPYIAQKRPVDARDLTDYQTVYAREKGAVAAPTAGLHFTPELLAEIDALGVTRCLVTLHVGAGTFLPVKTDDVSDHKMHSEWGCVSAKTADAINRARSAGGRLICVGTTSLRLIESAADETGAVQPFSGDTAIFITPGYRFRAVDMLMTNFHLPKSTLFMLVSAFAGSRLMREAYAHAIGAGYRFYSYGDSSLLYRTSNDPAP
jgi:S-adenosylmethionine:tRNA ribosyltransferase-isomerase